MERVGQGKGGQAAYQDHDARAVSCDGNDAYLTNAVVLRIAGGHVTVIDHVFT